MIRFDNELVQAVGEVVGAVTEGREPPGSAMTLVEAALGTGHEIAGHLLAGGSPDDFAARIRTLNVDELRLALFECAFDRLGTALDTKEDE